MTSKVLPKDWLEHTVQVEVPYSVSEIWGLWSDLRTMTKWMKWIQSVRIAPETPDISYWELGANGFTFTWKARILKQIPQQIIQWESIGGLKNRGAVRFYQRPQGTIVKLSIAYAIPGGIGQLMDNLFLGNLVESTLQADLDRFRDYAKRTLNQPTKSL
jgi:uncharacterized membrane protein